jgi:hydroxymethylpyrimidine pyrophosphatase-like HAD family hydrolase
MENYSTMHPSAAFDVDGCLIRFDGTPNWDLIDLLRQLKKMGWKIVVHSGGGKGYCGSAVRKLNLEPFVDMYGAKGEYTGFDLSFDDENVGFAKVNVKI